MCLLRNRIYRIRTAKSFIGQLVKRNAFLEQVRENILGSAIRELGVVNVRIAANMSVDLDCETRIRRQNGIKLLKYGHRLGNYFFLISHKVNVSQPDDIAWFLVFEYVWNIIINRITDC